MIICLRVGGWPVEEAAEQELVARLAGCVPRLAVERGVGVVWADVRGVPGVRLAERLRAAVVEEGSAVLGAGMAAVAGVARAAARVAAARAGATVEGRPVVVEEGGEAAFLAELPLEVLEPEARLRLLLEGVGIERCGALAALAREPVEVRFGAEGVALWRRARAEEGTWPFRGTEREQPRGSVDFVDYVVTDPARLLFVANGLLATVCDGLRGRGEHARRLRLVLALANGSEWRRDFRTARPTASRDRWLRLLRGALERLTVPDAVAGVALEVAAVEAAAVEQGDLFDRGFATAGAVEAALGRLLEAQGSVVVEPEPDRHPLPERRVRWRARGAEALAAGPSSGDGIEGGARGERAAATSPVGWPLPAPALALTLQLLPEPRPVRMETTRERGHAVPRRYREGRRVVMVRQAAGPDRISGGHWDEPYAREYFRCVTEDGALVWLYRDARRDRWFLHGWWD